MIDLKQKLRNLLREKISRQDLLILLMGYADGLTDGEIAAVIDKDVQFVRSRYAETIRIIHESLNRATEATEEAEEGDTPGVCKFCGCTDDHGCPGGCSWINEDCTICSACIDKAEEAGVKYD